MGQGGSAGPCHSNLTVVQALRAWASSLVTLGTPFIITKEFLFSEKWLSASMLDLSQIYSSQTSEYLSTVVFYYRNVRNLRQIRPCILPDVNISFSKRKTFSYPPKWLEWWIPLTISHWLAWDNKHLWFLSLIHCYLYIPVIVSISFFLGRGYQSHLWDTVQGCLFGTVTWQGISQITVVPFGVLCSVLLLPCRITMLLPARKESEARV